MNEPHEQQPNEQQHVPPPDKPDEVARSLTTTFIEGYAAKKLIDVAVPDAYQAAKDTLKKILGGKPEKPAADPPSPE